MVCVPCVLIPLFLYVWNKFLAPIFAPILRKIPIVSNFIAAPAVKEGQKKEASCPFTGQKKAEEPVAEKKKEEAPPGWECVDGVCKKIEEPKAGMTTRRRANKAE